MARVLEPIATAAKRFSARSRSRRRQIFLDLVRPTAEDRILDLGSEDGGHIASVVPFRESVWIADIDAAALAEGQRRYGFNTVQLDESGLLPFTDGHFDVVFSSSVIEHVTVDKDRLEEIRDKGRFTDLALERQRAFANEIRRVSKRYFVQTPHRWFPVESHTWLPAVVELLPRGAQLDLLRRTNPWWVKSTEADWNLLTGPVMKELFPDAEIIVERVAGLPKSLIAVRR